MMKVEIINNPYICRMSILINGKSVSMYSNLEKYINEPFRCWCDKILNNIYEECNCEPFSLYFSSRDEEVLIMKKIAESYSFCIQFVSIPLKKATPLIERIRNLNKIIKTQDFNDLHKQSRNLKCVISESLKKYENDFAEVMNIKNAYCSINTDVIYAEDIKNITADVDIIFLIGNSSFIEKKIGYVKKYSDRVFVIEIKEKTQFQKKEENIYYFESTEQDAFETITNCLLFDPLMDMFYLCLKSIPVNTRYASEIEELKSVEPKIIPVVEKNNLEVGQKIYIELKSDIDGYKIDKSQFNYEYGTPNIIFCNGSYVEGIGEGKTSLKIVKEGERIPCATVDFIVVKRNRIEKISIQEGDITIGEGDSIQMNVDYLPIDADNASEIRWESDNNKVATIDKVGRLRGISKGSCTIRCYAEGVSTSCKCIVKPYLREIKLEEEIIYIKVGQIYKLNIQKNPENCIDNRIFYNSMNLQIANVVSGTVKGVGSGRTKIIIANEHETVKAEVIVNVMIEKEYKKWTKQLYKKRKKIERQKKKKIHKKEGC